MDFNIKRLDQMNFRNFLVQIGEKLLIDRNDDFYSELTEWVDGLLTLMKMRKSYFSAASGFTPFFATLDGNEVEFETVEGIKFHADFYEVICDTIIFLFEQSQDKSYFERDVEFFQQQANSLLAGFRFRFKGKYEGFLDHLRGRELMEEELSI